jgi:hypothetical protein
MPHSALNFYQKLLRFERLNALNDRASTKTIHVSLNFDPSEKFTDEKLNEIAEVYMQKIGFADQPYLVYKHTDAGHPHIHIVSSTHAKWQQDQYAQYWSQSIRKSSTGN